MDNRSVGLVLSILLVVVRTQEIILVDDSDPSITYTGSWKDVPDKHQIGGSVKLARQENATASVKFNGTGISVFGKQGPTGGNITSSLYSVDGQPPTRYTVPSNLNTIQYPVQFYTSPPLPNGLHTLVITNVNPNSWFWLDFVNVTQPAAALQRPNVNVLINSHSASNSTSDIASTAPTTSSSSLSPSTVSVTDPTAAITLSAPASTLITLASSQKAVPTAAAVGIALSCFTLIALAIFYTYRWRKWRSEKRLQRGMPQIEPFERPDDRQLPPPLLHGTTHPYEVEHFSRSTNIVGPSGLAAEKASTIHRPRTVPSPDEQSPIDTLAYTYPIQYRLG